MPITIETQNTEFKENWRDEWLKTISAFANTEGGKILIGINDNGETTGGLDIKKLLVDLPNTINNKLSILPSVHVKEENGNEYLEIEIENSSVPISYNGKYYTRSGSTTQELNGNALTEYLQRKTGKTWDEITDTDFAEGLIDENTVLKFKNRAIERIPSIADEQNSKQVLEKLNLLSKNKIKNAGILLFYKDPQSIFVQSKIKIGKFRDEANLETQDIIHGNLFKQVVNSIEVLDNKYLKRNVTFEKGSIERKDVLEYPIEALREAILNAIVHKDYAITADIQIKIFDDKLVISNAGTLPPEIPIANLSKFHISLPRNPIVADVFQKAGYIEVWGRGTNKIVQSCIDAGLPEPEFKEENGVFSVTLFKEKWPLEKLKALGLNDRQISAVSYTMLNSKITNKIYREINTVSHETANNELKFLVDSDIFEKNGRGRSLSYFLKK